MNRPKIPARFAEAYIEMANKARFRPEAPSDGFGTALLDEAELQSESVLHEEAARYATGLAKQDDKGDFDLSGCTNFEQNRLFVYLLNAARLCFSGNVTLPTIKSLLKLANDEIASIESSIAKK